MKHKLTVWEPPLVGCSCGWRKRLIRYRSFGSSSLVNALLDMYLEHNGEEQ